MKTVVTGGAGYVGNLLSEALLKAGHDVTIVDNFVYGYDAVLHMVGHPNFHIVKQDIRDKDRDYVKEADAVFHLAAISGYPACEANPNSAHLINVQATKGIVDKLGKGQLLFYASTTSLYGPHGDVCTEDGPVHTESSLYSLTKHQGEQSVMERENSVSLRWATVFGVSPRMRAGLLLNDFVEKAVQEKTLVIYSGKSKRSFMHVRDSVAGYLFTLDHFEQMKNGIFNMGDARLNYSKLDLAYMIQQHIDYEIIESGLDDRDGRDFIVSYDKAAALGYKCEITVERGIAELVKLFRFYTPNSFIRPI